MVASVMVVMGCSGGNNTTDGGTNGAAGMGATDGSVDGATMAAGYGGGMMDADAGSTITVAKGPTKGGAIAISDDDSVIVACNRDAGTVSVFSLKYGAGAPQATKTDVDLGMGSEPWQVAISGDGNTAYVVTRHDQALARISYLRTTPAKNGEVAIGSEPTAVALSPTGATAWVASWVDGTVKGVETTQMTVTKTIDLNAALAATGFLGNNVTARPAMAHPRSIAITNNGDMKDDDESMYVTEYYAQRVTPESNDGANADTAKAGLVYKVNLSDMTVTAIKLGAIADIGFKDANNAAAGCYPNQIQSIAINGKFAYVISICASPKGPVGPKITTTTCAMVSDCSGLNLVDPACVKVDSSSTQPLCVDLAGAKTTTAPVVSVIDTMSNVEVTAAAANLNAKWRDAYLAAKAPDDGANRRYPLVANDIAFVPNSSIGYVTANGADAIFRIVFDDAGAITAVGSNMNKFIDTAPASSTVKGQLPTGLTIGSKGLAFTNNDFSHNVLVLDLATQTVATNMTTPVAFPTSPLPMPGSDADNIRLGRRFFNTGLGRWSLKGQGWGACQSCHVDGLSDNVTFYFARGPRQSISLDGTFSKKNMTDVRIMNWTAIFDEVSDFELNTRGVSGGVGAIVNVNNAPPTTADRINLNNPGSTGVNHSGLNGSSALVADPSNPILLPNGEQGVLTDWQMITRYVQSIPSPRAPTNLDMNKVTAGRALFSSNNCQGCHGGDKWTISQVFWTPNQANNAALSSKSWSGTTNGLSSAVLPSTSVQNQVMRFDPGATGANDQIQCVLRNVGTFGVAEAVSGIAELRADMVTAAQGNQTDGNGFNPPSLLGASVGAPYFHAGVALTLESAFGTTFTTHRQALSANFNPNPSELDQLVQFLLSIDADTAATTIPAVGAQGGTFCKSP